MAAAAGGILAGAAAATQVIGGLRQKKEANRNAEVMRLQARQEAHATDLEAQQQRKQNVRLLSKQQAQFAKAGVTATGTALQVTEMTAQEQEKNILANKYNSIIRQENLQSKARAEKRKGNNLLVGSVGKALGTAGSAIVGMGK